MDKLDLICKFVYLGDKEIGETIDIYEEKLIVKMGAEFAAIPMKNVERVEGEKIYVLPYDENDAFKVGKKWVEEKSKPVSIEELKIFGFGEESKTRFSVILKEIGDYNHKGDNLSIESGGSDEIKESGKTKGESNEVEINETDETEKQRGKEDESIIDRL